MTNERQLKFFNVTQEYILDNTNIKAKVIEREVPSSIFKSFLFSHLHDIFRTKILIVVTW